MPVSPDIDPRGKHWWRDVRSLETSSPNVLKPMGHLAAIFQHDIVSRMGFNPIKIERRSAAQQWSQLLLSLVPERERVHTDGALEVKFRPGYQDSRYAVIFDLDSRIRAEFRVRKQEDGFPIARSIDVLVREKGSDGQWVTPQENRISFGVKRVGIGQEVIVEDYEILGDVDKSTGVPLTNIRRGDPGSGHQAGYPHLPLAVFLDLQGSLDAIAQWGRQERIPASTETA